MKATYHPAVPFDDPDYAGQHSKATWRVDFEREEQAVYAYFIFAMLLRKNVGIKRVHSHTVFIYLPDGNPNPFTTDALRAAAAVGAAELGAVLIQADPSNYNEHNVWMMSSRGFAVWDSDRLRWAQKDGTIDTSSLGVPPQTGFRIHSFPPFTAQTPANG